MEVWLVEAVAKGIVGTFWGGGAASEEREGGESGFARISDRGVDRGKREGRDFGR